MVRDDGSVMSSLQKLHADEERRRADQIASAHRRKLAQEREVLVQEARRAEELRCRAEAAKHETMRLAAENRAAHERSERERAMELERVRCECELRAKVEWIETEQAHEVERLAILRDKRIGRLEGQRALLVSLLATVLLGGAVLYLAILRPEARRQEAYLADAYQARARQRDEFALERERLDARVRQLAAEVTSLNGALEQAKARSAGDAPTLHHSNVGRVHARVVRPIVEERCVDDNDPLCGKLK